MHQGWARAQPRRTPLGRGPRGVSHGPVMEALALLLPLLLLLLRDASSRDVKGERERPPLCLCVCGNFLASSLLYRATRLMNKVRRFMAETFNVHV
jgi:hypothetical protein